jgi:Ankyrin repeats (3 copies)
MLDLNKMQFHLQDLKKSFEILVEICHAIDSQDVSLLENFFQQDIYIESLNLEKNKHLICCMWDQDNLTSFGLENTNIDICESPLDRAINTKNVKLIETILDAGKHLPNWSICLSMALQLSIDLSDIDIIELLLSNGADPSGGGIEPLPIFTNDINLVKVLISNGADVNVISDDGFTPLMVASQYGEIVLVKLLVCAGANVNYVSTETPFLGALSLAAEQAHIPVYNYLLPLVDNQTEIDYARNQLSWMKDSIDDGETLSSSKISNSLSKKIHKELVSQKMIDLQDKNKIENIWDWIREQEVLPICVKQLTWQEIWRLAQVNENFKVSLADHNTYFSSTDQSISLRLDKLISYNISFNKNEDKLVLLEMDEVSTICCTGSIRRFPISKISKSIGKKQVLAILAKRFPGWHWLRAMESYNFSNNIVEMKELQMLVDWMQVVDCKIWRIEFDIF